MSEPFPSIRLAAMALLTSAPLSVREGGFAGQMAFSDDMTPKQARWFAILLNRHGLPPLIGSSV